MRTFQTTIFLILFVINVSSQLPEPTFPCVKQTSTHPNAPYNPDYTDGFVEPIFLSEFHWYEHTGFNFLISYVLNDMTTYGNTDYMLNVLNPQILNYPQLNGGIPIDDFDYYPEDGWELISINLGTYPDGTLLSEHIQGGESAFQDVPYIIFYNKQRSILRIFANTTTGLTSSFNPDVVQVSLKFNDPLYVSGILRTGAKYDQALDRTTDVMKLIVMSKTPGQANHWFMAQFDLGYDPCTCFFQSDLRVLFQFFDESSIQMTSNGISTEVNLVDELTGEFSVEEDFLASVDFTGDFAHAGTVVYNTMVQMYDDYIHRLEYVKTQNAQIQQENEKINDLLVVIKLAKDLLINPVAGWISSPEIAAVLVRLELFTHIELQGGNMVYPDKAKIQKFVKDNMTKGFDKLTTSVKKGQQELLKTPNMPSGTIWQATFDGAITNQSPEFGPSFFNPGSYPLAENSVTPANDNMLGLPVTAHSYPYYNEVLGLFALLETPKFKVYTNHTYTDNSEVEICSNVEHAGMVTGVYDIVESVHHEVNRNTRLQLQLNSPLRYVINPAAGVDMEKTTVKTAIVLRAKKNNNFTLADFSYTDTGSIHYGKERDYLGGESVQNLSLTNLQQIEGITDSSPVMAGGQSDAIYASPYIIPDILNDMIVQVEHYRKEEFVEYPTAPWNFGAASGICPDNVYHTGWADKNIYDVGYGFNNEYAYHPVVFTEDNTFTSLWHPFFDEYFFELKIIVDYYFIEHGYGGTENNTTQVYTYLIEPEDMIATLWNQSIPFDLVHNPVSTSGYQYDINPTLGLSNTFFDQSLYLTYPLLPSGFDVRALEQVIIEGELSVDQTLYPMAHVDIVAGNEIIIQNESIIQGDITLKLDEFWTSTTTPIVSNEDVTAFCAGLAPIQYQANSPSRSLVGEIAMSSMSGQLKTIFRIFPNPAQDLLNIKTTGVSDLQSVDVLSTIGTLILSVPASKFTLPNNVCINANTLESGTYYLRCTYANGETQLKSFVVVH